MKEREKRRALGRGLGALIPTAPAIKAYLRKHTAWQRLLLKGVQV